jgi:hypothetical protein
MVEMRSSCPQTRALRLGGRASSNPVLAAGASGLTLPRMMAMRDLLLAVLRRSEADRCEHQEEDTKGMANGAPGDQDESDPNYVDERTNAVVVINTNGIIQFVSNVRPPSLRTPSRLRHHTQGVIACTWGPSPAHMCAAGGCPSQVSGRPFSRSPECTTAAMCNRHPT